MNHHIAYYRTSLNLEVVARPDCIWQRHWFTAQKRVCVT